MAGAVSVADADGISVTIDEGSIDAMIEEIEENSVDGMTTEVLTGAPANAENSALDGAKRAAAAAAADSIATLAVADVVTISTIVEDSIGERVEEGTVSAATPDSSDVSAIGALVGVTKAKAKAKALAVSAISAVAKSEVSVVVATAISAVAVVVNSAAAVSESSAAARIAISAAAVSAGSVAAVTATLAVAATATSVVAATATFAVAAVAMILAVAVAAEEKILTIEEDSIEEMIRDLRGAIANAETLAHDGARTKTEAAAVVVISIPTTARLDALSIVGKTDHLTISRVTARAPGAGVSTIDATEETLRLDSPIETMPPRRVPLAEPTTFRSGVRTTTPTTNEHRTSSTPASSSASTPSVQSHFSHLPAPPPPRRFASLNLARHTPARRVRPRAHQPSTTNVRDACAPSPRARAPPRVRATCRA